MKVDIKLGFASFDITSLGLINCVIISVKFLANQIARFLFAGEAIFYDIASPGFSRQNKSSCCLFITCYCYEIEFGSGLDYGALKITNLLRARSFIMQKYYARAI